MERNVDTLREDCRTNKEHSNGSPYADVRLARQESFYHILAVLMKSKLDAIEREAQRKRDEDEAQRQAAEQQRASVEQQRVLEEQRRGEIAYQKLWEQKIEEFLRSMQRSFDRDEQRRNAERRFYRNLYGMGEQFNRNSIALNGQALRLDMNQTVNDNARMLQGILNRTLRDVIK